MAVIIQRTTIIAALLLAVVVAVVHGTSDGAVAALSMIDAGPAGSVIWD